MSKFLPLLLILAIFSTFLCSCSFMDTSRMAQREAELELKKRDLEAKMRAKGKVVYCIKDVPEGAKIPADALEEKEIEQSKIPQDALTSSSLCAGRIAKYGISQGQIVSMHDLKPWEKNSGDKKTDNGDTEKTKSGKN